jgi:protocatechuate 3,4-dioxygenase alpha subunit
VTRLPVTPSQTVGPFFAIGLPWTDGPYVVPEGTPGAITIGGFVLDGVGEPVPDALVETWQAAPDGSFGHPDDPRPAAQDSVSTDGSFGHPDDPRPNARGSALTTAAFRGFGRCPTGPDGRYRIVTLRPAALPCGDGRTEAPHLDVSVFARGLLDRVVTRIYFPDEEAANAADPVLSALPERGGRDTLIAIPDGGGRFRFDIRLQGEGETVFFDV